MQAERGVVQYLEELLVVNEPSRLQKIMHVLRQELRLIVQVSLKLGAALLVLQALAWLAASGGHHAIEAVTATAGEQGTLPAMPGYYTRDSAATARP